MRRLWVAPALFVLVSCDLFRSTQYDPANYPENPYPDISTVLVLPFINQTTTPFDEMEFGNICASELAKYGGVSRVYRPVHAKSQLKPGEKIAGVEDALRMGRALQADAILAVAVTDYEPYYPPRIAVTVQLLRVTARHMSAADVDAITQRAEWRSLPLAMGRQHAGHFVAAFEAVYDGHTKELQTEIDRYLDAQNREELGFKDLREFLMVMPRFVQFVSSQLINRLFEASI